MGKDSNNKKGEGRKTNAINYLNNLKDEKILGLLGDLQKKLKNRIDIANKGNQEKDLAEKDIEVENTIKEILDNYKDSRNNEIIESLVTVSNKKIINSALKFNMKSDVLNFSNNQSNNKNNNKENGMKDGDGDELIKQMYWENNKNMEEINRLQQQILKEQDARINNGIEGQNQAQEKKQGFFSKIGNGIKNLGSGIKNFFGKKAEVQGQVNPEDNKKNTDEKKDGVQQNSASEKKSTYQRLMERLKEKLGFGKKEDIKKDQKKNEIQLADIKKEGEGVEQQNKKLEDQNQKQEQAFINKGQNQKQVGIQHNQDQDQISVSGNKNLGQQNNLQNSQDLSLIHI